MKNLTKKHIIALWWRWSFLVMLIFTFVLGLIHNWDLFSFYEKTILLFEYKKDIIFNLPSEIIFESWYPKVFDIISIPFIFLLLLGNKNRKWLIIEAILGLFLGTIVGISMSVHGLYLFDNLLYSFVGFFLVIVLRMFDIKKMSSLFNLALFILLASVFIFGFVHGLVLSTFLLFGIALAFALILILKFFILIFKKRVFKKIVNFFLVKDIKEVENKEDGTIKVKDIMEAKDLFEAIRIGYDEISLGKSVTGPKGKLMLKRNGVSKEDREINSPEIIVCIKETEEEIILTYWSKKENDFFHHVNKGYFINEWEDKW